MSRRMPTTWSARAADTIATPSLPQSRNIYVDPLLIPIVASLMPLVLVPTVLTLKHRHKRREWEHRERMRAMDGPMPLMRPGSWGGSGGVAAIGAGVPIASVAAAFLT